MTYMDKIKKFIMDICRDALCDLDRADPIHDYQLEEWLDNNVNFRNLKDHVTGVDIEYGRNVRVKDLRAILSRSENDNMKIVIPVLDTKDDKRMHEFRYVRVAGILSSEHETEDVLCLSAPGACLNMYDQMNYNDFDTMVCKQDCFEDVITLPE